MTASPLRFGLVGAGRWADVHRRTFAAVGAELVAVATGSEAGAARVREAWGVPATSDLDELLAADLEAVVVASPNDLHAVQAQRALAAGKHVLVEKPMAIDLASARALAAAARASDRVLAVGHEFRVFRLFERVKALLDAGRIGEPLHLRLGLWRRPHRAGAGGWKADPNRLGSSVLEEPVHYLDLARWYLGDPTEVAAWSSSRPGRTGLHENLDVRLRFAPAADGGDRWALVTRTIAAARYAIALELVGGEASLRGHWRGAFDLDPQPDVGLVLHPHDGDAEDQHVPVATGHAYDVVRQTRAFVRAVREGTPVPAGAEDGRVAVELCLRVEEALAARTPLPFGA
ncbi:MAG: Gfo/Idh/MocA family oxidoreductase [Trueperaceae bacterium]|nr:Gfo/Idh/MocA family oxidoreductase [Trueperaceae bacterium]